MKQVYGEGKNPRFYHGNLCIDGVCTRLEHRVLSWFVNLLHNLVSANGSQ